MQTATKKLTVCLDRSVRLVVNEGDEIKVFPKGSVVTIDPFDARSLIAAKKAHEATEAEIKANNKE